MRYPLPLLLVALLATPTFAQDAPPPSSDLAAYLRGYELQIELLREKAALQQGPQSQGTLDQAIRVAEEMQRAADSYAKRQHALAMKRLETAHEQAKHAAVRGAEFRHAANESEAIQSLRELVTAQNLHGDENADPDAPKQGYHFVITGGEGSTREAEGTGTRVFFVDENGVIRFKEKPKAEATKAAEPLVVTFTLGPNGETAMNGKPLEGTLAEAIAKLTPSEGQGVAYHITAAPGLAPGRINSFTEELNLATSKAGLRFEQLLIMPPGEKK